MPSGNPETFLLLTGLNLNPERLAPWQALLARHGYEGVFPESLGWTFDPAAERGTGGDSRWLDDLAGVLSANPPQALFGYSLGGLLGLTQMALHSDSCTRAILVSPPLRLKRLHRLAIRLMGGLLPNALGLPSLAPPAFRRHAQTTVAAYRSVASLEAKLAPILTRWLAGYLYDLPQLFIAYAPGDELIDTVVLTRLAETAPGRIHLHVLAHTPPHGLPKHLGLDATTLGETEWERLDQAVASWLTATEGNIPVPSTQPSGSGGPPGG